MGVPRGAVLALAVAVAAVHVGQSGAQPPAGDPPYVVRGKQTEGLQRAFDARLEGLRDALAEAARREAPDLISRLDETRRPGVAGYQRLPRLVPDAPPRPPEKPQVRSFSWAWSDTLYTRQSDAAGRIEGALKAFPSRLTAARRAALEALIAEYGRVADAIHAIDADVGYNWFWQREIATNRRRFDAATRLIDAAVAAIEQGAPLPEAIRSAMTPAARPPFVHVTTPAPGTYVVTVAITTDIADRGFIERFRAAVESHWNVSDDNARYAVRLDVATVTPEALYCGAATSAAPACAPPAPGAQIDVEAHAARFPRDRAVLTTGASTLHVRRGRALALTPFDVTPRALAHEVGHLLGFPDAYLRGYRDLGPEGFRVLELIPDMTDIMAAPGVGAVDARHFRQLIAAAPGASGGRPPQRALASACQRRWRSAARAPRSMFSSE
jgi:hypothetical protein